MVRPKTRIYFDGNRALVPLTQGAVTQIDVDDVGLVSTCRWKVSAGYARNNNKGLMHRVILAAPAGVQVDHVDGDRLNNRRSNLRLCTSAENQRNSRARAASGFKGVYPRGSRWVAQINRGRVEYLGTFATPQEAARAYDAAALKHFGVFARCNFKMEESK